MPWAEIDPLLRGLVELLNLFPGIRTFSSCAGHEPYTETEIRFAARSLPDLRRLMRALPFLGSRASTWMGRPVFSGIYITAELDGFHLRLSSSPNGFHLRRLVGEIECALAKSL
jgi:hypothetical protein